MSSALAAEVIARLERGDSVDMTLPGGGRLFIDRPLPFLCLHRPTCVGDDPATEALITSQAAWLLAPEETPLADLLPALAQYQRNRFGACLLLELWTGERGGGEVPEHLFRLVAPAEKPPSSLLEQLENALLQVTIHRRSPRISVIYRDEVAPPGRPALLRGDDCTVLGLEIEPVYRHPDTGEAYTFAHRQYRRRLSQALKRAFYHFSHCCTRHRPPHLHALGPQAITPAVTAADAALAEISDSFDLLLHVTPVNAEQAWTRFRQQRFEREGEFLYRPRTIEPDLMKRRLYDIPLEEIDDPALAEIFTAKRDELARQITLVSDRNTPRFLLGSRQIFGDPDERLLALANDILERLPGTVTEHNGEMLDAQAFAARARQEVDWYRQRDPELKTRVEVRDDIAGIMVSRGNFLIGASAGVAASRVGAALAHEIGTHALTWHNGSRQPFAELRHGMADYEPLQEGLAVLSEYLVGQLEEGRLRQLAARVLAVWMISSGADFIETFRALHRDHGFSAKAAFMITMRTFRGGGYTKDAIYLRGLVELLDYLAAGGDLASLWLGKLSLDALPLVTELRWREILQPPALLPRFFQQPDTALRLERVRQGAGVIDLLEQKS